MHGHSLSGPVRRAMAHTCRPASCTQHFAKSAAVWPVVSFDMSCNGWSGSGSNIVAFFSSLLALAVKRSCLLQACARMAGTGRADACVLQLREADVRMVYDMREHVELAVTETKRRANVAVRSESELLLMAAEARQVVTSLHYTREV